MNTSEKKKTKIIATMGPAISSVEMIKRLSALGLNIVRLNFSHDDHIEHQKKIAIIHEVRKTSDKRIAVLQDLSGPKIRTGELTTSSVTLKPGKTLTLTIDTIVGDESRMSVSYKKLPHDIKVGNRILLNDGKIELLVTKKTDTDITTKIIHGGEMRSRRGVNLPDTKLSIPALTAKDKKDVVFGIKNNVDFMALSFVQGADDILDLKKILKKANSHALVIAKIETTEAIKNIDEIIQVSDGIMVARGDLAVEVGPQMVPKLQKQIIKKCNQAGKPVIVATQMLESMTRNPVPTRAEVSDVSNAIFDGADAIMLSEETAIGEYPEKVVGMMKEIALETESVLTHATDQYVDSKRQNTKHISSSISYNAARIAEELDAKVLVAFTETGYTLRQFSRYRAHIPILTISPHEHVLNQTLVSYGAYPAFQTSPIKNSLDAIEHARSAVLERKLGKKGDIIILVSGTLFGKSGTTNTITAVTL